MIDFSQIAIYIGSSAGGVSALYGAFKGYLDSRDRITDLIDRRRKRLFRVKSMVVKDIIHEDRTETIKLRTLRLNRELEYLSIDPIPSIVGYGPGERRAAIEHCYSLPGRAKAQDGMLRIEFGKGERLAPHKDHSVLLAYTIREAIETAFAPPIGLIATQPIGTDLFVSEVHFPPSRRLELNIDGKPDIRLYSRHPVSQEQVNLLEAAQGRWFLPGRRRPSANVLRDRQDFGLGSGETDWLSVSIKKPPQDADIYLEWKWEKV